MQKFLLSVFYKYNENNMKFIGQTQKAIRRNKIRIIAIRNEKLRKFRNSLRTLIRKAVMDQVEIFEEVGLQKEE